MEKEFYKNHYAEQIVQLLLTDPETNDDLVISSDLTTNEDGSYSFLAHNEKTGSTWKHTIKTEEV